MKHFFVVAIAAILPPISAVAENSEVPCEEVHCPSPAASQGYVAFIDPDTGELLTGDRAAAAAADESRSAFVADVQAQMRAAFDPEGLTEVRTETGAVAINLQGRFQSPVIATVLPEGPVVGHPELTD